MMAMDVSKGDSSCNPNVRLGMDITKNFSEQISQTGSSHCDLAKFSNNNTIVPCNETATTLPKVEICGKVTDVGSIGMSNNSSDNSKQFLAKQTESQSEVKTNYCISSSIRTDNTDSLKNEETPIVKMGLQSIQPELLDNNDVNAKSKKNQHYPLPKERSLVCARNKNEDNPIPTNVISNPEAVNINPTAKVSPQKMTDSDVPSNTIKAPNNIVSLNGHIAKQNPLVATTGDGIISQNNSNTTVNNEFMQQNHVFVFSTQLANKSADAVIYGQFPTIIDYHRSQPTTILFLEEFLKNPSKTTKLQRQFSLNLINPMQSVSQTQYWSNDGSNLNRLQPQTQRLPLRNVGISSTSKDNTSWNSVSILDNHISTDFNPMQTTKCTALEGKANDKSFVSSLQGVKVPDENLTPQQRQHREEQLAKLKKMNKFLFPENEVINEFQSPHAIPISSDSIPNSTDAGRKLAGIKPGNLLKSNQQNVEEITSIGLTESLLQPGRKSPLNGLKNELQNIKGGSEVFLPTTNSVTNISDLKKNQSDGQAVKANNSGSNFPLNNKTLTQSEGSNSVTPQTSWKKIPSNSLQNEFNNNSQQKNTNQAACFEGPPTCQNLIDAQPLGKNNVLPNFQSKFNNCNNHAPLPLYQQSTSIPPISPSNTSPSKILADSSLTPSNTPNVEVSNSTMVNYRGPSNEGPNCNPQLNSNNNIIREMPSLKTNMEGHHSVKSTHEMINNSFGMGFPTCNLPHLNVRQHIHKMPPHIGRRIDNIPLNPNLVRVGQNNNSMNFDPISSLTQMSQQLTGVGLGVRGGTSNELLSGGASMRGVGDASMEQCKLLPNSNCASIGGGFTNASGRAARHLSSELNGGVMFNDSGTMVNNKMCAPNVSFNYGGNNVVTGVGLRETVMKYNDMMPINRPLNRRENFESFNMTANVHVRASAPNTIQYMPVRAQNVNNIRMPQNMDMFQGYSNTQTLNNNVGSLGHTLAGTMHNTEMANMNSINMFGNCNRQFEQNELGDGGSVISNNNDFMNLPP